MKCKLKANHTMRNTGEYFRVLDSSRFADTSLLRRYRVRTGFGQQQAFCSVGSLSGWPLSAYSRTFPSRGDWGFIEMMPRPSSWASATFVESSKWVIGVRMPRSADQIWTRPILFLKQRQMVLTFVQDWCSGSFQSGVRGRCPGFGHQQVPNDS